MSIESDVKTLALGHFDLVGFAQATKASTLAAYDAWLAQGFHGEMAYLERHRDKKGDPQLLLSGAKAWISLALSYDTQEPLSIELKENFKKDKTGWIARYARGGDYHHEIEKRLNLLIEDLKRQFPTENFYPCVDTRAVLEREVAGRAGIGWVGKNTCLINQERGSFLFLAEILTTLTLESDKPVMDHCGTCTRCLDACPTGALLEPRVLDATQCISYWTIENDKTPPAELSAKFGYNVFGCDICQDVCPWNNKSRRLIPLPTAKESGVISVERMASASNEELNEMVRDSALDRAGGEHLRRSARLAWQNLNKVDKA